MNDDTQERAIDAKAEALNQDRAEWLKENSFEPDELHRASFVDGFSRGFDAGYQAGRWVAIKSAEDLPKEDRAYLWRFVSKKSDECFKVQHFTPGNAEEWFASVYSYWQKIVGPQATRGGEK